jgi:hypothetical protein
MFSRWRLRAFFVLKVFPQMVQTSFPGSNPRIGSSGGAGIFGRFTDLLRSCFPYGGLVSLIVFSLQVNASLGIS